MNDLSKNQLRTTLLESLFEQESRQFDPKLRKMVAIHERFDKRFNNLISKIIVEEDLKETFRLLDMLFELKEEMINLIVEREFRDLAKEAILDEFENEEELYEDGTQ